MDAVVYVRISQDRTGEEAGVERQREDCLRRANERGWNVVGVHTDNDISAAGKRKRPGFEAVLADVESGRAQVVIAWALDRLQRNRRDELRLYELCRDREVALSLVNGAELDFSTAAGRFVADVLGSSARMEVEMKADRQRRAQEQAAHAGKRVGGRRPFGFQQDGMTVIPTEAEALREGYSLLLSGVPLGGVARRWNAAGLTTGQGGVWRHDNVRSVLRSPRYAGFRSYNGAIVAAAKWPALVPEETWMAAEAVLRDPSRRRAPHGGRRLLSGLALCGVCGSTVHAGGSAHRYGMYRCSGSYGHVNRMSEPVDDYVGRLVTGRLAMPDAAELLHDQDRPDVDALRGEATALRARLESIAVEFADGDLTAAQLRAATARLRARLSEAESKLAHAGRVSVLGPLVGAQDVVAAWAGLETDRRRAVIDALMVVTLHPPGRGTRTFRPESVGIAWKSGE